MIFASALFIGHNLVRLETVDSTNDYALQHLAEANPANGTVISTENQTNGKGQYGAKWSSEGSKNLTLSIIIRPKNLDVNKQFYLSMVAALGVKSLCESYNLATTIKWPNDIYIKKKKVAGILIQNGIMKNKISSSVIGIGLNVNQIAFDPLIPNPTSIRIETGQKIDLEAIRLELFDHFERYYLDLMESKFEILHEQYRSALFQKDVVRSYQRKNTSIFNGIIKDVRENGKLCMEVDDQIEEIDLKDIKYIL